MHDSQRFALNQYLSNNAADIFFKKRSESEFSQFEPLLKSAKNRFYLSEPA